jgi:hypothetical protein
MQYSGSTAISYFCQWLAQSFTAQQLCGVTNASHTHTHYLHILLHLAECCSPYLPAVAPAFTRMLASAGDKKCKLNCRSRNVTEVEQRSQAVVYQNASFVSFEQY